MPDLLGLVPALPLLGFVLLALGAGRLGRRAVAAIGVGSVAASAVLAVVVAASFLRGPGGSARLLLWQWLAVGGFRPAIAFRLDQLSLGMMLVVTIVGALIHLYSVEFMADDVGGRPLGYSRFFAEMNLFVGSMLVLVLADDLLLLYLGWEGVGLCSFLLIGFWYSDPQNARAARKAFLVTRVGDAAMAIGLLLLVTRFSTLEVQSVLERAALSFRSGEPFALLVAALFLAGAVGKSAQLPLQTWLPDAMAGPTPVSALIHAATMVTAGVYLIARTHTLFELAPPVMLAVGVVGALTLLLFGLSALVQRDIKRALAYSTISQIGYMFVALGVGARSAALFHLCTHAAFKALLFLGAGAISQALHHQYDLFKMGGLRRQLPLTFWTFLCGAASLAGLPLVTAGFYSKDAILTAAWTARAPGGAWLWAAGLAGTLITSLYAFRLVFLAFFGEARSRVHKQPGWTMRGPLVALALLALGLGALQPALTSAEAGRTVELALLGAASAFSLLGLGLAYLFFARRRREVLLPARVDALLLRGWGFDDLYESLLLRPLRGLTRALRAEPFDAIYQGLSILVRFAYLVLRRLQAGQLRWYAAGIAAGAVLLLALVVLR